MFSKITHRSYRREPDFWRVRNLLIEAYALVGPSFNWDVRRWDGWHCHRSPDDFPPDWENTFHLWETDRGRLVGAVHPEGSGDAYLEIHPDFRWAIESEMLDWAEENLARANQDDQRQLDLYVYEYDALRRRLLESRGYQKLDDYGVARKLRLGEWPLPVPNLAAGYALHTTRPDDEADCERMAAMLNAGFGRTFHKPLDLHTFFTTSPSFRHDLNLVAETPDGTFAAHVGVNFEPVNRYAIFEPVCTHPDHRRKGLARSLMFEGLHRLKALGAKEVSVDTGDMAPANALYESIGFTEAYKGYLWRKVISV